MSIVLSGENPHYYVLLLYYIVKCDENMVENVCGSRLHIIPIPYMLNAGDKVSNISVHKFFHPLSCCWLKTSMLIVGLEMT